MKKTTLVFLGLMFSTTSAFACGIEGTAVNKDGSKINGTGTISTSWNSKKAFPKRGVYRLDLGSNACGEKFTVYLDGNQGQVVRLPSKGYAQVNFIRR